MKLENVQIEIKSKEHYEAVKKRLEELGKTLHPNVSVNISRQNYKVRIYIYNLENIQWNPESSENHPSWEKITLDDLYEVKKERKVMTYYKIKAGCTELQNEFPSLDSAYHFLATSVELGKDYQIFRCYKVVEE